jgi:hypothetical protein
MRTSKCLVALLVAGACRVGGGVDPDLLTDADGDGYFVDDPSVASQDCDDRPGFGAGVFPGGLEICDGLDNDCNGTVDDDGAAGALEFWPDEDGDGFGRRVEEPLVACSEPEGFSVNRRDCNDNDDRVYPNAPERCNGLDDNCNVDVDEGFDPAAEWHLDLDRDGFGAVDVVGVGCSTDPRWVSDGSDCNDLNGQVNPDAVELCDGVDNDCDRALDGLDDGVVGTRAWYRDADGDTYGTLIDTRQVCPGATAPAGYVTDSRDCNDAEARQNPTTVWYRDADRDGFGVAEPTWPVPQCAQPVGYALVLGDCDDADREAWEGRPWFGDADRDGFGAGVPVFRGCGRRPGQVGVAGDCADRDPAVFPGAPETCNTTDDDCDGLVDDADTNGPPPIGLSTWYVDGDGDGFGSIAIQTEACAQPAGYAPEPGDCDDTNPDLSPQSRWYRDRDRDGFGDPTTPAEVTSCSIVPGHVPNPGDCDDDDFDQNGRTPWWTDADGDGLGTGIAPAARGCRAGEPGLAPLPGDCDDDDPASIEGGCYGPVFAQGQVAIAADRDVLGVVVRLVCAEAGTIVDRLLNTSDRNRVRTVEITSTPAFDTCRIEVDNPNLDVSADGPTLVTSTFCGQPGPTVEGAPRALTSSPPFVLPRCSGCTDPSAFNYDPDAVISTPASCIFL